jgi:hypothetical protein
MTKTDELISKLEELLEVFIKDPINKSNSKMIELLPAISQLKEQIKKEENINDFTIPYLKSEYNQQLERITKIIGKKPDVFEQGINALLYIIENKVNPDVMPDTCCGKYEEEQSLKDENAILTEILSKKSRKNYDAIILNNPKESPAEQPLKSAEEILEKYDPSYLDGKASSGTVVYKRKDILKAIHEFASQLIKDITDTLPYPNPISKHQTDINIGWTRAMKYMKDQPTKDITDEEIRKHFCLWYYAQSQPLDANKVFEWMRSKMKSNGKI